MLTLSTTITEIDDLCEGGFGLGQVSEVFGPPGCGKTYIAYQACANPHGAVWFDSGHNFSYDYANPERPVYVFEEHGDAEEGFLATLSNLAIIAENEHGLDDVTMVVDDLHLLSREYQQKICTLLPRIASLANVCVIVVSDGSCKLVPHIASLRLELSSMAKKDGVVSSRARLIKNSRGPTFTTIYREMSL